MTNLDARVAVLLPCPFCGHETPEFERMGTSSHSCIVNCGNCGCSHESGDEYLQSGKSWNIRAELQKPAQEEITDAERFQYLCLDITDSAERAVRNALLDRLCIMSYSAACIDIDAAIRASKGEKT